MNRFINLSSEQAKRLYRDLAKSNHPDTGGDTATMQAINSEYAAYLSGEAIRDARARQTAAHAEGKKSAADYHDMSDVEKELYQKIKAALDMDGLIIELCGLWIWITGNTKANKDSLKAAGYRWAANKNAWYYAGVPSFGRGHADLDTIRNRYGSQHFEREEQNPRPAMAQIG